MDKERKPDIGDDANGNGIPEFPWHRKQRIFAKGRKPEPAMLEEGGLTVPEFAHITGVTGKRRQDKIFCQITYDETYVIEKLARQFGEILTGVNRSDVLKLLTKAKERYREIQSQQ